MAHDPKLGETLRIAVQFADHDGAPFGATGVVINARRPDGTTIAGVVSSDPDDLGRYTTTFIADATGSWLVIAECAGPIVVRDEKTFVVSRLRWDTA